MMGQGKGVQEMQNYEPGLLKILGDAIYSAMEILLGELVAKQS